MSSARDASRTSVLASRRIQTALSRRNSGLSSEELLIFRDVLFDVLYRESRGGTEQRRILEILQSLFRDLELIAGAGVSVRPVSTLRRIQTALSRRNSGLSSEELLIFRVC